AILLVLPNENVRSSDGPRAYRESELVAIAGVGGEKEAIKRHIKVPEAWIAAERKIIGNDAFEWPNETEAVLALNAIGLGKDALQFSGQLDLQVALRCSDGVRLSGGCEGAIAGDRLDEFAPHDGSYEVI